MGRATKGVRLINLTKKNDVIASVCKVMSSELEASVEEESSPTEGSYKATFSNMQITECKWESDADWRD